MDLSQPIFSSKDKDDYTKENEVVKVELVPKENSFKNTISHSPGESITGNIIDTKDITERNKKY